MQKLIVRSLSSCLLCFSNAWAAAPDASVAEAVTIETAAIRFRLWPDHGNYEIDDKQAGVKWTSNPHERRFGEATLILEGKPRRVPLERCQVGKLGETLTVDFRPLAEKPEAGLQVQIRALGDQNTLEFAYQEDAALNVESVRLLDDALSVTRKEKGYMVVPVREGLLIPADSGLAFTHRFDTFAYEGCHIEMFGAVQGGAAALITWHDPYAAVEIKSVPNSDAPASEFGNAEIKDARPEKKPGTGGQELLPALVLRKTARSFRVQFLGRGDYVTLAKAYRPIAQEKGWRVTWAEKLKGHPERAKFFGAVNYKLWSTLDRRMNEESTKEERVRVNWTFDETAQVAEHLKNDLRLDKVLFIMGGWIRRGYDNQHPDILPSAPECGGDAAFAECARRIRQQGYLLALHDNYQDIYRDSPSWDENLIMKNRDGSLTKGGHWAGGLAYLTCSQKALELARRPQNLPAVKKLTGADAYFIDTTYAAGLMECFDKNHPLTRWDDMKWKQAISDYGREVFGIFGSECGREWAIPHSDFFEGLTGVSGRAYHDANLQKKVGGVVVPIFEIVYRDCIALYGKYGYDPAQAAEYVLQHLSIGRPLQYHNIPPHLYWKDAAPDKSSGPAAAFTRADHGWAEGLHRMDRFVKNTYEILSPLHELTATMPLTQHQFLSADRKVQRTVFGEGPGAVEVVVNASERDYEHSLRPAGRVVLPKFGFVISSPTFVAFHASSWNGLSYAEPVLFTSRSLDGKPLETSGKVRVFHGFGEDRIKIGQVVRTVAKEKVVDAGE